MLSTIRNDIIINIISDLTSFRRKNSNKPRYFTKIITPTKNVKILILKSTIISIITIKVKEILF